MRFWLLQNLLALDQWINALLGGWADETLSSRAWRTEQRCAALGRVFRPLIDLLALPFERDHCRKSFDSEREQRQLPPEFRA